MKRRGAASPHGRRVEGEANGSRGRRHPGEFAMICCSLTTMATDRIDLPPYFGGRGPWCRSWVTSPGARGGHREAVPGGQGRGEQQKIRVCGLGSDLNS